MNYKIFFMIFLLGTCWFAQTKYPEINEQINKGNFKQAQILIESKLLDKDISELEKYNLRFQIELMERIRKDFKLTHDIVVISLKKYYPDLPDEMMINWEDENSLEMKIIDGEKRY